MFRTERKSNLTFQCNSGLCLIVYGYLLTSSVWLHCLWKRRRQEPVFPHEWSGGWIGTPGKFTIDQFRYIKIQPKTIDLSTRLWGINPTNSVVLPQSLVLRSIVLGLIFLYWNWCIRLCMTLGTMHKACSLCKHLNGSRTYTVSG